MKNKAHHSLKTCSTAIAACLFTLATPSLGQVYAGGQISEDTRLLGDTDTDGYFDLFGYAIDIDNQTVVVGTTRDDLNGTSSGSASLFNATTGSLITKLLPTNGVAYDHFGFSVSIDNGLAVVGAPDNDTLGYAAGTAYIFDVSTGNQIAQLLATDGSKWDWFGRSVAISDGIIAVGAPRNADLGVNSGSVYIFDAITGMQLTKLLPTDGAQYFDFGTSVAIHNGIVAVGAPGANIPTAAKSGAAYLFNAFTGEQIAQLLPPIGAMGDSFGQSISIDETQVAVGAPFEDDTDFFPTDKESGAVYIFNASSGKPISKLKAPDDDWGEWQFGYSVAIDSGIVVIGARNDSWGRGTAHIFDTTNNAYVAQFIPDNSDANSQSDKTGSSVSLNNGTAVIGAPFDSNSGGVSTGAVYIVQVPDEICTADLNGNGSYEFFDISIFLNAFHNADPTADFDNNGIFNFFDISLFLQAYSEGCP